MHFFFSQQNSLCLWNKQTSSNYGTTVLLVDVQRSGWLIAKSGGLHTQSTMGDPTAAHHSQGRGSNSNRKRPPQGNNWEARRGKSRRRFANEGAASAPARPVPICSVCSQVEKPKYKCPKCRDAYCSIQCCRDHKERGCSEKSNKIADGSTKPPQSKYLPQQELDNLTKRSEASECHPRQPSDDEDDDLEEGWKITDSMREAMERSTWLKNELKDLGLRQIIMNIDRASDLSRRNQSKTEKEEELEQAKLDYPRFKRFLDKLMVLTEVLERHGRDENTDLDQWLDKEGLDDEYTQLLLKPIDRPSRIAPQDEKSDDSGESEDDSSSSSSSDDSSSDDDSE
jgi:hypothetical protein